MNLPQLPGRPDCVGCDLRVGIRSVGVPTTWMPASLPPGPGTSFVLVLGQNPGLQEDRENAPFVGPSGRMVRQVYLPPTLQSRASFYLANTARCYTPADSPPRQRHYNACFPHTLTDLQEILQCHHSPPSPPFPLSSSPSSPSSAPSTTSSSAGPDLDPTSSSPSSSTSLPPSSSASSCGAVLCLGAPAAFTLWRALTGKGKSLTDAFKSNGAVYLWQDHPLHVFATFHPAAVLRKRPLIQAVADHIQLLDDLLTGVMASPTNPRITPVRAPRWS